MEPIPTTEALAAAALILLALRGAQAPLTTAECELSGTAAGYTRRAARDGLEWAIRTRQVRRTYGPRNSYRHQLASSPQFAGELANGPGTGVHVA